jgi:cysteinyl-tRNA synthetase
MHDNAHMIKFFNTMSGKLEPFRPLKKGEVKLYTCGPTVYDYAHIGNFRAYMFEDLLKRFLMFTGNKVLHVMNITDVEDKIIRSASQQKLTLQQFTKTYTEAFFQDIDILRILHADIYPRATEHIPEMVRMIQVLADKGYAYEKEGNWYFDISRFKTYGRLSKIDMDQRRAGVRIDSDEYEKESVHDFALWKAQKHGEFSWDTALGPGRPGWHVECSVMSSRYLGDSFDIHCGGVDNIFPHHENEIAQSEAFSGKKFVQYWMHCQHLIRDGQKMSKSRGNTLAIRDLIEKHGADPMAVRLLLLSTHYRKMLNFTYDALEQAASALQRIRDFLFELEARPFPDGEDTSTSSLVDSAHKDFVSGLGDDLNISAALSAVFGLIKSANIGISKREITKQSASLLKETIYNWDLVLGLLPEQEPQMLTDEIERRIDERKKARASRDYALSDSIRDELLAQGISLEDTPEGVRWKTVKPASKQK